jgi:ribosomal protein L37AE/L43A
MAMKERVFTDEHRRKLSVAAKKHMPRIGQLNGMFGKTGELNHRYGTKHTEATKKKMSESMTERLANGFQTHLKGVPRTDEVKRKISESKKKYNYTIKCPHCGKEGKYAGMKSWHFDNCRSKLLERDLES